ncbi:hypothetical protein QPK14_09515 [Photorhabdus temperata subsp. temperata]
MTEKEEFLAYLAEMGKIIEKWPDWKKVGLRTPRNPYIPRKDKIIPKTRGYAIFAKNKLV